VTDEKLLLRVLPLNSVRGVSLHDCPFSQSAMFASLRQGHITRCRADDILVDLDARTGRLRVDVSNNFIGGATRTNDDDDTKDKVKIRSHVISSFRSVWHFQCCLSRDADR
jgi:hypothetical protein